MNNNLDSSLTHFNTSSEFNNSEQYETSHNNKEMERIQQSKEFRKNPERNEEKIPFWGINPNICIELKEYKKLFKQPGQTTCLSEHPEVLYLRSFHIAFYLFRYVKSNPAAFRSATQRLWRAIGRHASRPPARLRCRTGACRFRCRLCRRRFR